MREPGKAASGLVALLLLAGFIVSPAEAGAGEGRQEEKPEDDQGESRLPDEVLPLQSDLVPDRPPLLLELGEPFLGSGPLSPGIELPGGAVWQPAVWIFGTYRTAVQVFHDGNTQAGEWVNRLDLFGQLKLSGTERVLVGIRPFDNEEEFSGYAFDPHVDSTSVNGFHARVETAFFEGDVGEMLPVLDPGDVGFLDFGFAVGRQPVLAQDGILINDTVDGFGLVRNTLLPGGTSNVRITGLYGWENVERNNNEYDDAAHLALLLMEADLPFSTMELDGAYLHSTPELGDALFGAFGAIQRIGELNTTFRVATSQALDLDTPETSTGYLFLSEISMTPHGTEDLVYATGFWAVDHFSSAARGPGTGGPLGRVGILYAAQGLGRYDAPLSNEADQAAGGAGGYQMIRNDGRQQWIWELGGRTATREAEGPPDGAVALGSRFQRAVGQRLVFQIDAFVGKRERRDIGWGARFEIRLQF